MTSGAAGVPATAGDDAGTADLTADPVRFRQFVVLDLAAAVAGVVTLVATWAWLGASWLWPVAAATATSAGLLVWSLRLYRRGAVDRAVLAVCATFWLMLVVATLVVPSMFPGFALLMVWPVLFALQHVRRSDRLVEPEQHDEHRISAPATPDPDRIEKSGGGRREVERVRLRQPTTAQGRRR